MPTPLASPDLHPPEPAAPRVLPPMDLDELPDLVGGVVDGYRVGAASDDAYQVGEATYSGAFEVTKVKALPIAWLVGGASFTPHERSARARQLAERIRASGEISPILVDDDGEVLEGQHRLEAMALLGATHIPGVVLTRDLQTRFLEERAIDLETIRRLTAAERAALQADFTQWLEVRRLARTALASIATPAVAVPPPRATGTARRGGR